MTFWNLFFISVAVFSGAIFVYLVFPKLAKRGLNSTVATIYAAIGSVGVAVIASLIATASITDSIGYQRGLGDAKQIAEEYRELLPLKDSVRVLSEKVYGNVVIADTVLPPKIGLSILNGQVLIKVESVDHEKRVVVMFVHTYGGDTSPQVLEFGQNWIQPFAYNESTYIITVTALEVTVVPTHSKAGRGLVTTGVRFSVHRRTETR